MDFVDSDSAVIDSVPREGDFSAVCDMSEG
jgi:hypothetical protein